jgi:hypothetical protein
MKLRAIGVEPPVVADDPLAVDHEGLGRVLGVERARQPGAVVEEDGKDIAVLPGLGCVVVRSATDLRVDGKEVDAEWAIARVEILQTRIVRRLAGAMPCREDEDGEARLAVASRGDVVRGAVARRELLWNDGGVYRGRSRSATERQRKHKDPGCSRYFHIHDQITVKVSPAVAVWPVPGPENGGFIKQLA